MKALIVSAPQSDPAAECWELAELIVRRPLALDLPGEARQLLAENRALEQPLLVGQSCLHQSPAQALDPARQNHGKQRTLGLTGADLDRPCMGVDHFLDDKQTQSEAG